LPSIYRLNNTCVSKPGKTPDLTIVRFTKQAVVAFAGMESIHVKLRRASKFLDGTARRHPKTFSLLPDRLASRLPGTLIEVEEASRDLQSGTAD
jgi:hypothetical protein